MSTKGEAEKCEEPEETRFPPEWEARPGCERMRAAVYAPPERRQWIEWALNVHVSEIKWVRSLEEIAYTDADLVLISHEKLIAGPNEFRTEIERRWREDPDPFWVVIDAPYHARVTYQHIGADIAVNFGTSDHELSARISALLKRAQTERDRSPLTGLPGNLWLRRLIGARLEAEETITLVMADIDDFKGYNDRYGHLAGDDLIVLLAKVLRGAVRRHGDFLAHVGGDDYCVVCRPAVAERLMDEVESEFEGAEFARDTHPAITVVGTTVAPEEIDSLHGAFERLAALRAAARTGR